MRYLPSLTPLRGIAALLVVMFHLTRQGADPTVPGFFLRGYLGVDLFFILSGFVLTHVYVREFLAELSWRAVGAFLWARVARVYPVHIFILAVLVIGHAAQDMSTLAVLENFLLVLVPWPVVMLNPPAWSVSAEWYAYLLFPFMIGPLWRCNGRIAAALCGALLIGLDIFIAASFGGDLRHVAEGWSALARALPEFVIGVITYRAFSDGGLARHWQSDATFVAIAVALLLAAALPNDVVVVALLPPLLLAAVSNAGVATRLLNVRPLRWLGDISYSIYLGQALAFSVVATLSATWVGPWLGLTGLRILAVAATFAIATLTYRAVEVPCRSLLRRAPDQLRRLAARA
jgi:peptidoglycan/LPS O-acetylase OafA/YrhL